MHTAVNPYTASLAVAGAGILTLGLVTAPPGVDPVPSHHEVQSVQLAAATASAVGIGSVDTNAAPTAAAPPSLRHAAAVTIASASSLDSAATTATSVSTWFTTAVTSVSSTIMSLATRVAMIAADIGVGASLLAVILPVWLVLSPVTFFYTGLGTVLVGCPVTDCFSQAALNFFIAPFTPSVAAFQQAYQQTNTLINQIVGLVTGTIKQITGLFSGVSFAGPGASFAAAAASPLAKPNASAVDLRTRSIETTQARATRTLKSKAVATKAAVDAVDAGLPSRNGAVADANPTPNPTPVAKTIRTGKTGDAGKKPPTHRASDSVGKHRKN